MIMEIEESANSLPLARLRRSRKGQNIYET
jgi:hypothetical protein